MEHGGTTGSSKLDDKGRMAKRLNENRDKRPGVFGTKSSLERDVERSITDLLVGKDSGEPIRIGKKIVKTPDSFTTITYELVVNPQTGQQEVVENVETTKHECAICGGHYSQVLTCADCGVRVCANDSRQHTWTTSYMSERMFHPDHRVYNSHNKTVCKSCARTYGIKD